MTKYLFEYCIGKKHVLPKIKHYPNKNDPDSYLSNKVIYYFQIILFINSICG